MGEVQEFFDDLFEEHVKNVQKYKKNINNKDLLELYGLYKQSLLGNCPQTNNFKTFKEKKMYESWYSFKGYDQNESKQLFINKVTNIITKN
jgi:acyl-CoA-binding protein